MSDPAGPAGPERGPFALFGALTGVAITIALCVAAGVTAGWLLDEWLGTPHVFVFAGLLAGVALAVLSARGIVRKYF